MSFQKPPNSWSSEYSVLSSVIGVFGRKTRPEAALEMVVAATLKVQGTAGQRVDF